MNNTLGLVLCFTYIFAMIGLASRARSSTSAWA